MAERLEKGSLLVSFVILVLQLENETTKITKLIPNYSTNFARLKCFHKMRRLMASIHRFKLQFVLGVFCKILITTAVARKLFS